MPTVIAADVSQTRRLEARGEPTPISFSPIDSEDRLEEALYQDISILDPGLMVVGRQVDTAYGTRVDLLAMNSEGDLAVIELKRDRTPREVVAQVLDYASWIEDLSYDRIAEIHQDPNPNDFHLDDACAETFDVPIRETLNESHEKKDLAAPLYHDPNLSALAARPFSGMIVAYARLTPQDAPRDLEVPSRELAMP